MKPPDNHTSSMAKNYHDETRHSYWSVRQSGHHLDWENKPFPFKVYPTLASIPLPREFPRPSLSALDAIKKCDAQGGSVTLENLASLLFFSAGVTKKKSFPGGQEYYFRAAASTGALYEVEVYLVAGEIPGLAAGVYHFCPGDFSLRQLRDGDYRQALARAAADESIARAPVTLILTAIFWRNVWKYQARAYRHCYWDSGTMLANSLAAAAALQLPARIVTGFIDADVERLIGIDGEREGALELFVVGSPDAPAPPSPPIEPIQYESIALSQQEVEEPLILEIHAASALATEADVHAWRHGPLLSPLKPPGNLSPIQPLADPKSLPLSDTIVRRGSTRRFAQVEISFSQLSTVLHSSTQEIPVDAFGWSGQRLSQLYLIVNAVEGLHPGAYYYWPEAEGFELIKAGEFRAQSAHLCLEQELGADASAVIFFFSDLREILSRYGNRGYRLANLEAGIIGGKCYLAAYSLGLGASGLTFYDNDTIGFFSPHSEGKDAIFVTALGRAAKGLGQPVRLV